MTEGRIEAFLKLFCITESNYGSWQSWTVLLVCLSSAIATASSGSYFHRIDAVKSSVVCFVVSTVGFSMAFVTLLAIVIGCKRRPRIPDPESQIGETTIYSNPVTSDQSTSIAIEESPSESQSVEQMWMNPVFAEYDKSLYEADWNKKDNGEKDVGANNGERDDGTDIDERDSDYFHSSSETMTWSYKSYSEDEGYFPHSSKESNLKEVGRGHAKSLSIFQEKVLFSNKKATPSVLKVAEIGSLKSKNDRAMRIQEQLNNANAHSLASSDDISVQKVSNNQQNSEFGRFHVPQNEKMNPIFWGSYRNSSNSTSCFEVEAISNENLAFVNKYGLHLYCESEPDIDFIDDESIADVLDSSLTSVGSRNSFDHEDSCEKRNGGNLLTSAKYHNGYVTPELIGRNDCLKQGEHDNEKYLTNNQVLKEFRQSNEGQILSKATTELVTVVEDENSSKRSNTKNNFTSQYNSDSILSHEAASKMNEMHNSNLESIADNRNCYSVNKFDYDISYEEDYSNSEITEIKAREQSFIPRYSKRPLLDINGAPISQKELVKVLSRLLISGLQDKPKIVSHSEALI